jgi:hypothetical protein
VIPAGRVSADGIRITNFVIDIFDKSEFGFANLPRNLPKRNFRRFEAQKLANGFGLMPA